jgi:hypothetical protein
MKRKNSETSSEQNFAQILQKIKSILPERFACQKITELEQSAEGLESATAEDLREIKEELENFIQLLNIRYSGDDLKTHQNNINAQIEAIETAISSTEFRQSTRQRSEGAAEDTATPEQEESQILEPEEEILPQEEERAAVIEDANTIDSDTEIPTLNSQNSADILSLHQDSSSTQPYIIIQAHQIEESLQSTQSLSLGDTQPLEGTPLSGEVA